jgi:hypothetical protein
MLRLPALAALSVTLLAACSAGDTTEPLDVPPSPAFTVQAVDVCTDDFVPLVECAALVALYNSTNGPDWGFPSAGHFAIATNPCTWATVYCGEDALGPVLGVILDQRNLTGPLPPELANLTSLTVLGLFINNISGPIPAGLGSLADLHRLDLSENDLTGPIPASLGDPPNLSLLSLGANQLSGGIPPELGNHPVRTQLGLSNNQLSGPIPPSLGNSPELTLLRLEHNQLTGPIPAGLGNATKLTVLRLQQNQLTGPVPAALGNLTHLEDLRLSDNQLTGQVPLAVAELGGQLAHCDFSGNAGLYMPDAQAYRDADADDDGAICAVAFSSAEDIGEDAVDGIEELVPDPLNGGQANALTTKLENAMAKAAQGQYSAAINQLNAFISQLNTMVAEGMLTHAQAAPFIEQAEALIAIWTDLL